jgi:hypothetical protein
MRLLSLEPMRRRRSPSPPPEKGGQRLACRSWRSQGNSRSRMLHTACTIVPGTENCLLAVDPDKQLEAQASRVYTVRYHTSSLSTISTYCKFLSRKSNIQLALLPTTSNSYTRQTTCPPYRFYRFQDPLVTMDDHDHHHCMNPCRRTF